VLVGKGITFDTGGVLTTTTHAERNHTMSSTTIRVDIKAAEDHLMKFLAIDSVTGQEAAIGASVSDVLKKVGVPASAIRHDTVHKRIPVPTEVGNLIVDLPGTRKGPRLLFSTHLDTVPLCAGAKPRREGDRIVSDGTTALGGDNGTGCAVLVTLAETLLKHKLPHPPITLLFTVREESGLHGARELDSKDLGGAAMCFNVDSTHAAKLTIGAVGQTNWEVEINGKAAHAGVAPEKGISAMLVASIALTEAHRGGWFGKVVKPEGKGSSNPGVFGGKEASRPVTPPTSSPTTSTYWAKRGVLTLPSPGKSRRRTERRSRRRRRRSRTPTGRRRK
jgi:tripeptide aminopeptidase